MDKLAEVAGKYLEEAAVDLLKEEGTSDDSVLGAIILSVIVSLKRQADATNRLADIQTEMLERMRAEDQDEEIVNGFLRSVFEDTTEPNGRVRRGTGGPSPVQPSTRGRQTA